jgi:sigma54-dependent transcription regulator
MVLSFIGASSFQVTTGTHVAQICWLLLAEARYLSRFDLRFEVFQ